MADEKAKFTIIIFFSRIRGMLIFKRIPTGISMIMFQKSSSRRGRFPWRISQ